MPSTTPTSKVGRANKCAPWLIFAITLTVSIASGQVTNLALPVSTNLPAKLELPPLPAAGPSIIRVMGALALVLGIFFGGVWLYRNWQRLTIQRGRAPKLNVLETRPLGGKHALYVIGYEQERFLLSASPNGVSLITHLPAAEKDSAETTDTTQAPPSFAQALTKVLKGK
jgi:flagellar biogenesis protein FliO